MTSAVVGPSFLRWRDDVKANRAKHAGWIRGRSYVVATEFSARLMADADAST